MGPVLGIGQVVHELVQHISTGGRQVYPFRCDHVIHKLVQHISTEGGSEQEGNLSFKVFLYKGLQYMLSCMVILPQGGKMGNALHTVRSRMSYVW